MNGRYNGFSWHSMEKKSTRILHISILYKVQTVGNFPNFKFRFTYLSSLKFLYTDNWHDNHTIVTLYMAKAFWPKPIHQLSFTTLEHSTIDPKSQKQQLLTNQVFPTWISISISLSCKSYRFAIIVIGGLTDKPNKFTCTGSKLPPDNSTRRVYLIKTKSQINKPK